MQNFDMWQIWINVLVQGLGTWLAAPMQLFSLLGSEEFYMLVMPALYWCVDSALGLRVGVILLLSNGLGMLAKLSFHAPRPYWIDARVHAFSSETTFGLPSAHAQNAVSLWGLAAVAKRHKAITAICIAIIALIGFSRVYLGVHFAGDVILGWLFGLLLLVAFLALEPHVTAWINHLSLRNLLIVCAAISMLILIAIFLADAALGSWQTPPEWASRALEAAPGAPIAPRSLDHAFTTAGTWLGFTCGAAWLLRRKGRFPVSAASAVSATPQQLLLRYVIGAAGVLLFWYGLGAILPREATILSYCLRYLRYALVGLWISALAPLAFQRLRLLDLN
jgi:membrane-associated phospholipid phosphatase